MQARMRGFSLIESLIALLILSIAMLGIGGLFAGMLKDQRSALYRMKAVALAADMAGRIRSNPSGEIQYSTDAGGAAADKSCNQVAGNETPAACSPQDMAIHDRFEWQAAVASPHSGLPEAEVTIAYNSTNVPPDYLITISWLEGYNYLAAEVRAAYSVSVRP